MYFIQFSLYLQPKPKYELMKLELLYKVFHLYYDGFRTMTLGKTLWTIILIKLVVIFLVLKLFFFPDYINSKAKNKDKAEFVSTEMLKR